MKYVDSGSGKLPLISLIALLSISLTVNLPGLAVSPLLGKLKDVFPDVSELETQLLIVLPNFVIIPFILWSGKLCNLNNQIKILCIGLVLYIASGVLFIFADSMVELIVLSCLLGVGCGLVIPLAASLIAQYFVGTQRTRQLGMKSGVSNFTVIIATLFVGWVASLSWHLAFLVYLVPIIPLALVPFMTRKYIEAHSIDDPAKPDSPLAAAAKEQAEPDSTSVVHTAPTGPNFHFKGKQSLILLIGVIGLYIALTYSTMVVSDYLPFTMKHYDMNTKQVGLATSIFFLAATCSGFTLTRFISVFKNATPYISLGLCIIGLYACGFIHIYPVYLVAIFIIGYGYGLMQPIIYDKTAYIAPTIYQSTTYFAYTLTGNYIAIAMVPFVVDGCAKLFGQSTLNFPYILNATLLLVVMLVGFYKCRSFVFNMKGAPSASNAPAPAATSAKK